jgi:hypothetical protein
MYAQVSGNPDGSGDQASPQVKGVAPKPAAAPTMPSQASGTPSGMEDRAAPRTKDATPKPAPIYTEAILSAILEETQDMGAKVARIESAVSQCHDDHLLELLCCTLIDLRTIAHRDRQIENIANKISGALYNAGGYEDYAPRPLDEFDPALHRPSPQGYPTGNRQYHGRVKRTRRVGIKKDGRAFKRFAAEVELYELNESRAKTPATSDGNTFAPCTNTPKRS